MIVVQLINDIGLVIENEKIKDEKQVSSNAKDIIDNWILDVGDTIRIIKV